MDWRENATCGNADAELFFPLTEAGPSLAQITEAKAICARCPVVSECLADALDTGDDWAVRGGTTAQERRQLTRTR